MRVLSFSYCFPNHAQPTWGIFVAQRLEALARRVDLQVVSPVPVCPPLTSFRPSPGPVRDTWRGLKVYRPRFWYVPKLFKSADARLYARGLRRRLRRLVAEWRPDMLDAHFIWPDGVAVGLLARELGVPYSVTLRGKIYPCLDVPSQRRQCCEALQNAAAVVSVSDPMAVVARELGAAPERVHVVPNGVDTNMFRPVDRRQARRRIGLDHGGPLLATVGHLGRRKGHHEVIQALSHLDESVRLVLVGGDRAGGADTRALQRCIDRWGVRDRVLLAGVQPHEEIPLYLGAADVSVLASYREGCPNVVLESLACGRPVVATAVGTVPKQITDGVNGYVVPVRDPDRLAVALRTALGRDWDCDALASAVTGWDRVAEEVHNIWQHETAPE